MPRQTTPKPAPEAASATPEGVPGLNAPTPLSESAVAAIVQAVAATWKTCEEHMKVGYHNTNPYDFDTLRSEIVAEQAKAIVQALQEAHE